jgi:hypothetical protein
MKSQTEIGNSGHSEKQSAKPIRRVFEFLTIVALIVVLVLLLRPAIQKAREKANRTESANNLKQIGKAFQRYHESYGKFPPAVVHSKDGEPLYSWRVLLLPFLGEDAVYSQFKLDEAWDSPNNQPLLAKMPLVYAHPTEGKPKEPYATHYQVFTGGGAIFDTRPQSQSPTLKELDAAHRTNDCILAVEGADAVPWTKP